MGGLQRCWKNPGGLGAEKIAGVFRPRAFPILHL